MNVPTPPPSSKGSSAEAEFSTSPKAAKSSLSILEVGYASQTAVPNINELGAETSEPIDASTEIPIAFDPRSTIKVVDTEMSETPNHHDTFVKQEDLTLSGITQHDEFHAASELVKVEEIEMKSEAAPDVMSEIKSELEPEANSSERSDLPEQAQKLTSNENQGRIKKPKQPRRAPAKTARDYHQRKQQDSTSGIRKFRKIIRNINPEKLLNSIAHQDPVSAYNAGPSNGVAPIMTVSTKKDFMQQMRQILSAYPETDFQKFKIELAILDEDSRSFGFKRMEMKNGMWMLKGMKSRKPCHICLRIEAKSNIECSCLSLPDEGCCLDGRKRMFYGRTFWWNSS
jgi:hypothetical protein